jgi:hypothetical protein
LRSVVACDWRSGPLESQGHQNYQGLPKLTEKTLGKRKKQDGEEEEGMWNKKSILW